MAVLIDGFIPGQEHLASLDWEHVTRRKRSNPRGILQYADYDLRIRPHLEKEAPWTDDVTARVHDTLVQASREAFCPYAASVMRRPMSPLHRRRYRGMCFQSVVGTGRGYQSLERPSFGRGLEESLSTLQMEYRADERGGRRLYVQNVLLIPQLDSFERLPLDRDYARRLGEDGRVPVYCQASDECERRWTELTAFHSKPEDHYEDFPAFTAAWHDILDACIDHYTTHLRSYFPRVALQTRR